MAVVGSRRRAYLVLMLYARCLSHTVLLRLLPHWYAALLP